MRSAALQAGSVGGVEGRGVRCNDCERRSREQRCRQGAAPRFLADRYSFACFAVKGTPPSSPLGEPASIFAALGAAQRSMSSKNVDWRATPHMAVIADCSNRVENPIRRYELRK